MTKPIKKFWWTVDDGDDVVYAEGSLSHNEWYFKSCGATRTPEYVFDNEADALAYVRGYLTKRINFYQDKLDKLKDR